MPRRRPATASGIACVILAVSAVAGCTSSASAPSPSAAQTEGLSKPATTAVPASTPPPSGPTVPTVAPSSAPVSSDTASTTAAHPPPPGDPSAPAPRSTCASLAIRVIRGSGDAGQEFAALQFTNTGATACVLNGYATVTLLLRGKQVGKASTPSGSTTSTRRLAPGATAESRLTDFVRNCQAPLSDTIRVLAPGSDLSAQRPGQLRACTLHVGPLGAPE